MAEVIQLAGRRSGRSVESVPTTAPILFFDLASPATYLVAERIERRFGAARWRPAVLWHGRHENDDAVFTMDAVERRARALRMPLVWPDRFPVRVPAAMRVATYAAERGCGGAFAIAVGRLAFCGGFDVEDPDILAEATAAAGLDVVDALAVARDPRRDHLIVGAGRALWVEGGTELPALRYEGRVYCGEERITAVFARATTESVRPYAS